MIWSRVSAYNVILVTSYTGSVNVGVIRGRSQTPDPTKGNSI